MTKNHLPHIVLHRIEHIYGIQKLYMWMIHSRLF